jgi:hypothetical protein
MSRYFYFTGHYKFILHNILRSRVDRRIQQKLLVIRYINLVAVLISCLTEFKVENNLIASTCKVDDFPKQNTNVLSYIINEIDFVSISFYYKFWQNNMGNPFDPSSTSDLSACDESFIYIIINLER